MSRSASGESVAPHERARAITDPVAMRALAHPVRLSLLEQLDVAESLTATQAADLLGITPALASFHLRTLARYGFVEEAGPAHGRHRPWRARGPFVLTETDRATSQVAKSVGQARISRLTDRITEHWTSGEENLTEPWRELSACINTVAHLAPEELRQLEHGVLDLFMQYADRTDPAQRPEGSRPVELAAFVMPAAGT